MADAIVASNHNSDIFGMSGISSQHIELGSVLPILTVDKVPL